MEGIQQVTDLVFDQKRERFYVSQKDGRIASLDRYGEVVDAQWIENLDAPTALTLDQQNDQLWVASHTSVIGIDVETRKIKNTIVIEHAKQLNDLGVDSNGFIYALDTKGQQMFVHDGEKLQLFWKDLHKGDPSSMVIDNEFIYVPNKSGVLQRIYIPLCHTDEIAACGGSSIAAIGNDQLLIQSDTGLQYVSAEEKVYPVHDSDGFITNELLFVPELNQLISINTTTESIQLYTVQYKAQNK